ncbi:biotin carboxyl carrier protein of acetyl-CoAcarboxylase [Striga asiatica]|uniref:Biotin carboxyl carrier protein of acetyl-CoAcarboxylase n=1 Tax=Striga asiatica TaxID=4170 RepID=A0A5A7NYS4_STRAF|nr:biotin carboxyl carrier protein of acetyl-CoAcarboxylase [Striga asiatica]
MGSLCQVFDSDEPWYLWMLLLKNENFNKRTTLCPENGKKVDKIVTNRTFPCFGEGCANQPLVYHNQSRVVSDGNKSSSLVRGFYGLHADLSVGAGNKKKFFSTTWHKNLSTNSWIVSQKNSQFYLFDIGSFWKNNVDPYDYDVITDVTRYSKMIINPSTLSWCRLDNLVSCPPYHSFDICDPYSNPQAQELVQNLPHPEWVVHGYPEKKEEGWVDDPRTWKLYTGAGLSSRLYFYHDPGTKPATLVWSSLNVGTEIYVRPVGSTTEWTVSDFHV